MAEVLPCCSPEELNQPYIGVDQSCNSEAIFCIVHSPHKTPQGLLHQMLPLKQFKKTLHQKKFKMNQKISVLTDQYNNIMDSLIEQIKQLKLRKNIQLSMLWLRELAKDQQQYEIMRQIYRMDFKGLTCSLVHGIYFKILHNQVLQTKSVSQIGCYKGISQVLDYLSLQKHTKSFLAKKITQIEGVLQNGQILKRALPDKKALKGSIKEVLLETPFENIVQVKYNKSSVSKNCRQYVSVFSKYPLLPHLVYHMSFNTKYTNVMLGVCTQTVINLAGVSKKQAQEYDRHYHKESIVLNCTNGCTYRDGMFESGSNHLTKGRKQLILKLRITQSQLIITFGKHIVCRTNLTSNKDKLYLHVLLRTEGDSFQVDRDKDITSDQNYSQSAKQNQKMEEQAENKQADVLNYEQRKKRNQQQALNAVNIKSQFQNNYRDQSQSIVIEKKSINESDISEKTNENRNRREQLQKQKLLNEFMKKERMDKILSQIKSKPVQRIERVRPAILKVKPVRQQFKNSKINIVASYQPQQKLQSQQEHQKSISQKSSEMPHIQIINPKKEELGSPISQNHNNNYNLYSDESFNFQNIKSNNESVMMSPIAKINDLIFPKPDQSKSLTQTQNLGLNLKKVQNSKSSNQSSSFLGQSIQKSTQILPTLANQQKKKQNHLKPQQKSFKLCEDESFHFQDMKSNYDIPGSPTTPISKMNDLFDFQKKENQVKKSLRFPMPDLKMKKVNQQARQDSVVDKSVDNSNYDQSQIISAHSISDEGDLKHMKFEKKNNHQMPELRQTHFSKISSKSKLDEEGSSFINQDQSMLQKPIKIQPILIRNKGSQWNDRNPMQLMNIMQSAIGIKSDGKKSMSQLGIIEHLGSDNTSQMQGSYEQQKSDQIIPIKINSPRKVNRNQDNSNSSFQIGNTQNKKEVSNNMKQSQIRISYNNKGSAANDSWL